MEKSKIERTVMSHREIKARYLEKLQKHFFIQEKVSGQHFSGKKLQLDAVLRPHTALGWKNPDVTLGIDFKDVSRFAQEYDTRNLTSWLAECVDYANTRWENYGFIYVFACPSLIDQVPQHILGNEMFVRNFMGQLGIGELKELPYYGLTFLLHGHHRIWSEDRGVESGKQYSLIKKFGSR